MELGKNLSTLNKSQSLIHPDSISGAIWNNILPRKLLQYLPEESKDQARAIYGSMVTAKKFPIGSPAREAIDLSYRETQKLLAIAATAALAPMLIIMFFLKGVDLRNADQDKLDENRSDSGEDEANVTKEAVKEYPVKSAN